MRNRAGVNVVVDPGSPIPPYEQVRAQVAAAMESGRLGAEERLPPVRRLAADLHLAVNTVARAYRELELAGLVETRGRHGTFVAGPPSAARAEAAAAAHEFAAHLRRLGIGPHEILAVVQRELAPELGTARAAPSAGDGG